MLWSNTLTRCSRHQHSVSLLHLSELDFWEDTYAGNCPECSNQSLRVFQTHYDQVQAECLRRVPVPDPVTGRWKRPRPEHTEDPARQLHEEENLSRTSVNRATSVTSHLPRRARVAEPCTNWQDDSGTFTTAPVHWPVVYRNTACPAKQTRV